MGDTACTIRTRKFLTNRLLGRKQFVSSADSCCMTAPLHIPRAVHPWAHAAPLPRAVACRDCGGAGRWHWDCARVKRRGKQQCEFHEAHDRMPPPETAPCACRRNHAGFADVLLPLSMRLELWAGLVVRGGVGDGGDGGEWSLL